MFCKPFAFTRGVLLALARIAGVPDSWGALVALLPMPIGRATLAAKVAAVHLRNALDWRVAVAFENGLPQLLRQQPRSLPLAAQLPRQLRCRNAFGAVDERVEGGEDVPDR